MRTNINKGLSTDEVKRYTEQGLDNRQVKNQSKTVGQIICGNIFTYFNLIFAIFAGLLILVRSYVNMTFLPVILANTMIGIIQELRSKRVLDKLTLLNAHLCRVYRDGMEELVRSEKLVLSDLVIFEAGNQVCADARIESGEVRVNEALVTGEADEIIKGAGDELLSGSFIVSGQCEATLTRVGLNSYAAKLAIEAKASRKKEQTEMIRSLDKLVKIIGILIIPIGIMLFCQGYYLTELTIQQSVVAMIAALVGMIPEGLYLLASVALVVSVMRLAGQKVLVHEMACVETLARVNVLCVDKTGTITENKMSVEKIVPLKEEISVTQIKEEILQMVSRLEADNITMRAIKAYFESAADNEAVLPDESATFNKSTFVNESISDNKSAFVDNSLLEKTKMVKIYSFSSETKYSAVVYDDKTYLIGAPEKLLLEEYEAYKDIIMSYSKDGSRVLVYGKYDGDCAGSALTKPVEPRAVIVLSNAVRKDAQAVFEYFEQQGVEIKVISGDNPVTVSNVANQAGIANASRYLDASLLTDEELKNAAPDNTVFGRVSPQQKKVIIESLKAAGKVVAMTGDGVNDVLALKAADCSIAFASGSEAAANASQLVMLDSDFSGMPAVVMEGRRVVNNIQRTASLFLIKNIFSMLMAVFTIIVLGRYPLFPTQISLLGAFTIGVPGFLLAIQPNRSLIRGNFIKNVAVKALPAGITDFIMVAVFAVYCSNAGIQHEQISTACILVMLFVGVLALIRVCMPFNKMRIGICVLMILGICISIVFLPEVFAIYPLNLSQIILTIIMCVISAPVFIGICRLSEKIK